MNKDQSAPSGVKRSDTAFGRSLAAFDDAFPGLLERSADNWFDSFDDCQHAVVLTKTGDSGPASRPVPVYRCDEYECCAGNWSLRRNIFNGRNADPEVVRQIHRLVDELRARARERKAK